MRRLRAPEVIVPGAGGLVSTVDDYLAFAEMLRAKGTYGGERILSRPSIEVAKSVGTYGWDGGLGTSWCTDPAEDMMLILMTQRAWTSPAPPNVCLDLWTSAYQALDDRV